MYRMLVVQQNFSHVTYYFIVLLSFSLLQNWMIVLWTVQIRQQSIYLVPAEFKKTGGIKKKKMVSYVWSPS